MSQFQRIASIFSFAVFNLFTVNAFAEHTQCPPPADIHYECMSTGKKGIYDCNWTTSYRGWEGDDGFTTNPNVTILSFTKAIWYGRFHQVNCFYQDSNGKTVTMIPTWFGQTAQPKGGNWQTFELGQKFICTGSPDTCPFIYK